MPTNRADEWIGVLDITIPKYLKEVTDLTIRNRYLLKRLEQAGRLLFNQESTDLIWDVQYAEPPVQAYGDSGVVIYDPVNCYKQASLDWRGYVATDKMSEKQTLMNKGNSAIVKRYEQIVPNLMKAMRNRFGTELYIDGYAAGNENNICGFESWCGTRTAYNTVGCAVADLVATPSDTYGQLSTAVGQSGSWSTDLTSNALGRPSADIATDWPEGKGDSEYDYWTPKLINYASTSWGAGGTTFTLTGELAMSRAIQWLSLTAGSETPPNICFLAGPLMSQWKAALMAKRYIFVPHKQSEDLGFGDTLNYEGLAVRTEFGMPANTGYIFPLDELQLMSPAEELFYKHGPYFDPDTFSYKFAVACFAQLRITAPKFFAKLYPYAAS